MMEKIRKEIETFRAKYGDDIVTDMKVYDGIASYTFMPHSAFGYIQEYNLETGEERHCGLGPGCFWTEWQ